MIRFDPAGDEARMLADMAARFVGESYSLPQRAEMARAAPGAVPKHWGQMAELGWLAAPLPEAVGGLGLPASDLVPLVGALGAGLVLEPYGPAVLDCAVTVAAAVPEAEVAELLAPMLAGERVEVMLRGARAERDGDGWVLRGAVGPVRGAASAAVFWVAAEGAFFRVDADKVERTALRLTDGQDAARVVLDGVVPEAVWDGVGGALDYGADYALFGALAEMNGLIDALYRDTLDYVKMREQFGRPIGKFQSVQHRMAEMFIHREEALSMTMLAAEALDEPEAFRRRALSAARVKVGDAARAVLRDAVQLHGGMGVTDELRVGHMVKRLLVLGQLEGSRHGHLERFLAA